MSWTDIFPVLSDELVEQYLLESSCEEKKEFAEWFGVQKVYNPRTTDDASQHVVAASLFWKNTRSEEPELPPLTRELLLDAKKYGLVRRFEPWSHYVQPLLDSAEQLAKARPDVVFRVYLAADMGFLIPDFVERACEVHLMQSSSIRHNPGAMWRFLALEHKGMVTITDSDRSGEVIHDIERTELMGEHGLKHWRVPYTWGDNEYDCAHYRTILACQFGSASPLPVSLLIPAMLWHTRRGSLPTWCQMGPTKRLEAFGCHWPDYGFDEWFLNVAIYPRIAFSGVLTFVSWINRRLNHWFALDIEYVTWANPKSEILHHGPTEEESTPISTAIDYRSVPLYFGRLAVSVVIQPDLLRRQIEAPSLAIWNGLFCHATTDRV